MPTISAEVDTSGLRAVIPDLVDYGRRTTAEQCVTSLGMILQDAQNSTKAVGIEEMDAELDYIPAEIKLYTDSNGKTHTKENTANLTEGELIVMARSRPDSNYNQITGGRWRLQKPLLTVGKFIKAYGDAGMIKDILFHWIQDKAEQMKRARHSSGHFLQAGYIEARNLCVSSPLFKNRFRARSMADSTNSLNTINPNNLGELKMTSVGQTFQVVGENNVGDRAGQGSPILDAKHRDALLTHSLPKAQEAVDREAVSLQVELARRIEIGMPKFNQRLS